VEGPLELVRAAILAASPHNTQPWLFKISSSRIELYLDVRRNVGALDPLLREAHIGLGCALENLMLAAAANGYAASATLSPGKLDLIPADPKPLLVASVDLAPGSVQESELYAAIPKRHTNRSPYDSTRLVSHEVLDALRGLGGNDTDLRLFLLTDDATRQKIVEISNAANAEIYSDRQIIRDSDPWVRTQWSAVQKYRDGLTIDSFGLSPATAAVAKMMTAGMLRRVVASAAKNGYSKLMLSAPLIGIIAVRDRYDREQSLRAGRLWQRAHLLAAARGVAGRPCNEAVEIIDHEKVLGKEPHGLGLLAEVTGDLSWQPTFVFYMGHPTVGGRASPRRDVRDVVI
jgi:nitroreductase